MKVLVVNPILYTSETSKVKRIGTIKDTMIYNMCLELLRAGHEPVLVAALDYKPIKEEKYDFEVIFFDTKFKKIFKPNCFPWLGGLRSYMKKNSFEYDFIISSEVFSMSSLYMSIWQKKKTIIWHELAKHNNILKKIPSIIWYNIIARICFKNTRIVPRSKNAYDFISKYCNNVSDEYIDHGVNLEEFNLITKKRKKQFVVLSQLIKRKRIDGIIDVFADFVKKMDNEYVLYIIGIGDEEKKLKEKAKAYRLEEKIIFTGFMTHEEMKPILGTSQAMIINTEKDNNMVSIVESLALGTPIITTDIPYNVDYIKRYKLGVVKEKLSYSDLKEIVDNNLLYVNNCINYREKISNEYHVKQFIQEYKKVIGEK